MGFLFKSSQGIFLETLCVKEKGLCHKELVSKVDTSVLFVVIRAEAMFQMLALFKDTC